MSTTINRLGRQRTGRLLALVAAASLALSACNSAATDNQAQADDLDAKADLTQQSIVVSNWEGYMPEDTAQRFKDSTGATMKATTHATNEDVMAKLTAGSDSGIDVAFVSGPFAQALAAQGLTEPIHEDLVPNLENLYPEATELAYDEGNKFSVPYTWGTTGLCYRSDKVSPAPTSWNDLLDPAPEHVGRVTMMATDRWLMLPAQKSLGFSANTKDAGEMDQVKDVLVQAKKNLLAYDDTTFYERLVSGEADLVEAWDGWCNYGIAEDPKIKFVVPDEGSDLWADTMVVMKTSENKEAAFAFINMMLDPEMGAWVAENILYNVPNEAAQDKIPAELKEQYTTLAVSPADLLDQEALTDLGDALPTYTKLVSEITASK